MADDLDPNAIAAEFLKQNLDTLLSGAKGFFKETSDKLRLHLDGTYKLYLTNLWKNIPKRSHSYFAVSQFR